MVFSSMIFLWIFLPIILILYYLAQEKYRNLLLLVVSLIFYAWGEPVYVVLMLAIISLNYLFGICMGCFWKFKRWLLLGAVVCNLLVLFYFKYFDMFAEVVNGVTNLELIQAKNIALPIGISFFIFQAMSYVIDLYRGEIEVQKNWNKLALYISFFPQLIAGPIVKYKDICDQINVRICTTEKFVYGIKRFIYGVGKKVIIANTMARIVDNILLIDGTYIGTSLSWCVAICYSLQIYFDFSGYSDMAIGLGRMFGFDILENFNYPYISQSIQEFWRRWHISLSTWFKEYLYIPLGGNRKGNLRTYLNLFVVFFTTGLWHGASYNYVLWGLYHGFFSILERLFLGKLISKNRLRVVNHIYALLVVLVGWVLFRVENLYLALQLIKNMFVFRQNGLYGLTYFVSIKDFCIVALGVIIGIIVPAKWKQNSLEKHNDVRWFEIIVCLILFMYSIILLVCNTYNPFIYFRF